MTLEDTPLRLPKPSSINYTLKGIINERIQKNIENWLLTTPKANPIILEMFNQREHMNRYKLMPWAGEFAGKYLTSCVLILRLGNHPELYNATQQFVLDLIATQELDGYLGPWAVEERLYGKLVKNKKWSRKKQRQPRRIWDFWGHYHCIYGLLLWYQQTRDEKVLKACENAMTFLYRNVVESNRPVSLAGSEEMNMAIYHGSLLLYKFTRNSKYMVLANHVEQDFQTQGAGDYYRLGIKRVPFWQTPKPRWESLHAIQGLAEKFTITKNLQYKTAFESLWWSMLRDRHNTGGWSSGEKATGNPYNLKAIETCCTVSWIAVTVDMLKLTRDSRIADELELSTYNGMLGGQHPSGRWWTYDTPMEGYKRASMDHINFQAHPGGPELNCCSVNGPRGPGMIADWAILLFTGGIYINYFEPGHYCFTGHGVSPITIDIEGDYPRTCSAKIKITKGGIGLRNVYVRIPQWSEKTSIIIRDEPEKSIDCGRYFCIRTPLGEESFEFELEFDFSPHFWIGDGQFEGKSAIYRGPLLLALDSRHNPNKLATQQKINLADLQLEVMDSDISNDSWITIKLQDPNVGELILTDFSSTAFSGTYYTTWFNSKGLEKMVPSNDQEYLDLWTRRVTH